MKFEKLSDLIRYLETFNPDAEILTDIECNYFKKPGIHCSVESEKTSTMGLFLYGEYTLAPPTISVLRENKEGKIESTQIIGDDLISKVYQKIHDYIQQNIVDEYALFKNVIVLASEDELYEYYITCVDGFHHLEFKVRHKVDYNIRKAVLDFCDSQGYPPEIFQNLSIYLN